VKGKFLHPMHALSKAVTTAIQSTNYSTLARNAAATALTIAMSGTVYAQSIEEVSITGSRIQRPGLSSPTPVTSITRDETDLLSTLTLAEGLDALPQFLNSALLQDTQNQFGGGYLGAGGQATLNLRGAGTQRTLVLLDGRRFVPSNRSGGVDISMFPQRLIQRTDVVTGGASAAYGSDAVTGVTNFILNNEFEGFDANIQYGASELGDAKNYKLSMAGGVAVGNNGNFVWGIEGFKSDEIPNYEGRDWYKSWGNLDFGPAATPRRVRYEETTRRFETFGGIITRGPLRGTHFLEDGTAAPFQSGSVLDLSAQTNINAANPIFAGNQVGGTTHQIDRWNMARAANERFSLYTNYKHQITDNITGSVQVLVSRSNVDNQKIGYVISGTWPLTIYSGNPFLPRDIQAKMTELNLASFRMDKAVPQNLDPLMNSRAPTVTEVGSVAAALDGTFSNGWNWSAHVTNAHSNRDLEMHGFRVDRLFKGADVVVHPTTGATTCRSTLIQPNDGCVPLNLFGIGNTTQEGRDWVHDYMTQDADYKQTSAEFVVNGEVFDGFGAGPIFMAGGINWRDDRVNQRTADAYGPLPPAGQGYITDRDANGTLLYRGLPSVYLRSVPVIDRTNAAAYVGQIDVWEGFTEFNVPLLRDVRFVDNLNANVAARYTKYSTIEAVWAWKGGLDWQINDELRLRMTRSRDIRAGSIFELFDTTAVNAFVTDDPWRPGDETYIAKNVSGGNPNVMPEDANTLTYGFVYQPNWLAGSAFSVDYYDIKITDAISQIGTNNIINFCYDQGLFCDQLEREPSGRISAIINHYINVGMARTRGMDFEASYRSSATWFNRNDNYSLRVIASRLLESSIQNFNSARVERVGNSGLQLQDLQLTLTASYMIGPLSASWSTRWVNTGMQNPAWVSGIDIDNNFIPSHHLSNLRLSYNLDAYDTQSSVYLAVSNVFDKNPGHLNGLPGLYDVVGRNYSVGMNVAF
jgi:iron complex outermembrane recepter protein